MYIYKLPLANEEREKSGTVSQNKDDTEGLAGRLQVNMKKTEWYEEFKFRFVCIASFNTYKCNLNV